MTLAPEHAELSEHLNAFLDGALDGATRQRLVRHLDACPACQVDLEGLRATRDAVRALPALRAPRSFALPVPTTLPLPALAPVPAPVPGRSGTAAPWLAWSWRLGSLGAAACLMLSVFLSLPGRSPQDASVALSRETAAEAPAGPAFGGQGAGAPAGLADRNGAQRVAPAQRQAGAESAAPAPPAAPTPAASAAQPAPAAPPATDAASPASGPESLAGRSTARTAPPAPAPAGRAPAGFAPTTWLTLAFLLAVASAALFAIDRRRRPGAT